MGSTWNDYHIDRLGDSIMGVTGIVLAVAVLLWPLGIDRPAKEKSGGCCKVTEHRSGR